MGVIVGWGTNIRDSEELARMAVLLESEIKEEQEKESNVQAERDHEARMGD